MRLMITGSSGLLGLNLAFEASKNHDVIGVDLNEINPIGFTTRIADLLVPGTMANLLDEEKPDWLIHCAALASVDASEENPELAQRLNTELSGEIAEAAYARGVKTLYISTDAVFDGQKGDYLETDTPNPKNVYAKTKLDGERAVLEAAQDAIVARVNFYGWSLSGKRSLAEFFFNNLEAGKPIKGFTDVYYNPMLVNDLAEILLLMFEKELSGIYHVVSSEKLSKYEFAVRLANTFGFDPDLISPISVQDMGLKGERTNHLTLNTDKLVNDLGIKLPGIDEGLKNFSQLFNSSYPVFIRRMIKDQAGGA
jgi:dTDP-4-dehydrorhamnose reductase